MRGAFGVAVAVLTGLLTLAGTPQADARVVINVDKSQQQMTVSVNGVARYRWDVSTGRASFSTPVGVFTPQRLERSWFSRKYYNSPMPHSIFFHRGYAIHGSYEISRLGGPASHGCIRLHPQNAATLFALVKGAGAAATTIVVRGETPERGRRHTPMARTHGPQEFSAAPAMRYRDRATVYVYEDEGWSGWGRRSRWR